MGREWHVHAVVALGVDLRSCKKIIHDFSISEVYNSYQHVNIFS